MHGCGAPASWAARHTTVCLDFILTFTSLIFLQKVFGDIFQLSGKPRYYNQWNYRIWSDMYNL